MLAKKYRLQVQSVGQTKGRSVRGRYFLLRFYPGTSGAARIAVVVSKKTAPKATQRNAMKRTVYHAFQTLLPQKGYDVVVSPLQYVGRGSEEERAMISELEKNLRIYGNIL